MLSLFLLAVAVPQEAPGPQAPGQEAPAQEASAQEASAQDGAPQRIVNAQVYGNDACPVARGDEIIVCRRLPEGDRFRLPSRFRQAEPTAGNTAWATRVETIDEVGRQAGGLPNTCSTIGAAGATGCTQEMIRRWYAERRAARAIEAEADGSNRGR